MSNTPDKRKWRKLAKTWQCFTSPIRPTAVEINIMERFCRNCLKQPRVRVLLLGATPEIRDMLSRYRNASVTLLDKNQEMIIAMTKLMKSEGRSETHLFADWLRAHLRTNYYNIIIGDSIFASIQPQFRAQFLAKVHRWIKQNGVFVIRAANYRPKQNPNNLQSALQLFSKRHIDETALSSFSETVLFLVRDPRQGQIQLRRLKILIDWYVKSNGSRLSRKQKQILTLWRKFYCQNGTFWSPNANALRKHLERFFRVVDVKWDPNINMAQSDYELIYKLVPRVG